MSAPALCLVYLAWTPYGIAAAERFIASYRARPAGVPHRLALVLAGPGEDRTPWHRAFEGIADEVLELGAGIDLDHYRAAADRLEAESLCFLNTASEVLVEGWLARLAGALSGPGVGIVGATGSYETPNSLRPGPLGRLRPGHEPFPNPHLRTNGFALRRELLLELEWPVGLGKLEAVALEGGSRGLTRQVLGRGLGALVVGRDGVGYPPERWRESGTFRVGEQPNLLLADNRTRHYQDAGRLTRSGLSWLAWRRSPRP